MIGFDKTTQDKEEGRLTRQEEEENRKRKHAEEISEKSEFFLINIM